MIYKTIDEWIKHNPNHRGLLPIEVCHQIWGTKDNKTTRVRVEEDDDIQDYKKPWVGLTQEEVERYWDWEDFQTGAGRSTIFEMVRDIEAKLKEKNT
jgi:hypothetical protein